MKTITCFICHEPIEVRPARGRKSGKPFLLLVCVNDARHFRGFIGDQQYVKAIVEGSQSGPSTELDDATQSDSLPANGYG